MKEILEEGYENRIECEIILICFVLELVFLFFIEEKRLVWMKLFKFWFEIFK